MSALASPLIPGPDLRTRIVLREYERRNVKLSSLTAHALQEAAAGKLEVSLAPEPESWLLTATQHVGAIVLDDVEVLIRPKISVENVMVLLDVGLPDQAWRQEDFAFATDANLLPIVAAFFARTLERAVTTGLLRSYRAESERLATLRGRIDFPTQIRQPGMVSPVACRFEEYTADIDENRYLKAAVRRLLRVAGVRPSTRQALLRQLVRFEEVTDAVVDLDLPDHLVFTRLNRHYQPALGLARLVLRNVSLIDQPGDTGASSFLVDMNELFQRFVADRLRRHLRRGLEVDEEPTVHLGRRRLVPMRPDLMFRVGGVPVYVGDAKYKLTETGLGRNADYYQLLAYTTALELPEGVLVYGQSEGVLPHRQVEVEYAGKRLMTYAVDLRGSAADIEQSVATLADWVVSRATESRPARSSSLP